MHLLMQEVYITVKVIVIMDGGAKVRCSISRMNIGTLAYHDEWCDADLRQEQRRFALSRGANQVTGVR